MANNIFFSTNTDIFVAGNKNVRKARMLSSLSKKTVSVYRATGQIFSKRSLLIVRGFVCERTPDSSPVVPISITCDVRANFSSSFFSFLLPATYARANRRFFPEIGIVDQVESSTLFDPEALQPVTRHLGYIDV